MKLLILATLIFWGFKASAQIFTDAAYFSLMDWDQKGDQTFEARTGLPPIFLNKKDMLIGSLTLRETTDPIPSGEKLHLSDHATGLLLVVPPENNGWGYLARVGVNYGNATTRLRLKNEAAFPNGFFLAKHSIVSSKSWILGIGAVYLGKSSRIPAVPAAQFEYKSEGEVYRLLLGFPALEASYGISKDFIIGSFANFVSNSYLLEENSSLRAEGGDYVGVDRITMGLMARTHIIGLLWLNSRLGYSIYGKTKLLNGSLHKVRNLDNDTGIFALVGLGIAIPSRH